MWDSATSWHKKKVLLYLLFFYLFIYFIFFVSRTKSFTWRFVISHSAHTNSWPYLRRPNWSRFTAIPWQIRQCPPKTKREKKNRISKFGSKRCEVPYLPPFSSTFLWHVRIRWPKKSWARPFSPSLFLYVPCIFDFHHCWKIGAPLPSSYGKIILERFLESRFFRQFQTRSLFFFIDRINH